MSSSGDVAAVIVAWNSMNWLPAALESLRAQSHRPASVVVVDNASSDRVAEFLAREHPDIHFIRNQTNQGFAYAANQGIDATDTEWVLALNPDVVLDSRYLERLLDSAAGLPDAGSLTGLLYRPNGGVDSAGMGLRRYLLRPLDRQSPRAKDGSSTTPKPVFGACAAAALYRRGMLEDVRYETHYFDSAFFAYFEDVDLAWRAQHRGWKAYLVAGATAVHVRGASGGEIPRPAQIRSQRNRYLAIYKNFPARRFASDFAPILLVELARMLRHPLTQPAGLWQCLRLARQRRVWRLRIQRTATASGHWYLRP